MKIKEHDIVPNLNGVGVIIKNINLGLGLTSEEVILIKDLLYRYRVVIFQEQDLTDQQLEEFSFRFGPPFVPDSKFPVLGSSESAGSVVIVGNQAHEYAHSYLGHQEVLPHSDHQWLRCPSAASLLYAIDIGENAASTIWTDMVKAYDLLDVETQKSIKDLKIITFNPFYRPFGSVSAKYVDRIKDVPPGDTFAHPLVRTHPVTQEKILYINDSYEMELVGLSYDEGSNLCYKLISHIKGLMCRYEHHWKNGDLILWDNQATLHYRPAFGAEVRRVLKRVTIGGGIPY